MSRDHLYVASQKRLIRRLLQHHLLLAVVSTVLIALFFINLPPNQAVVFRLSMATAYTGLLLLAVTLLIGPLNILISRRNPISTDLRRDIGIWSALIGIIHVLFGLQVHMSGKFWLYFLYPINKAPVFPLRHDLFGLANYIGLFATLILILLLGLSNDICLRWLGSQQWKALQRWNYGLFALIGMHAIAYQFLEKRQLPYVFLLGAIMTVVITLQITGYSRYRQNFIKNQ